MEMMKNSITNFPDPARSNNVTESGLAHGQPGLYGARQPEKKPDEPSGDRAFAHRPNPELTQRVAQRIVAVGGTPQPGRFIWQLVGVLATYDGMSLTGASVIPVFSGL